ncbi:MAG: zinc ribbon domain-containing protein [Acetobacterium sp.]
MYLLSGLMRCPCGSSYIAHYRNERPGHRAYASYNCSNQRQTASKDCQNRGIEMTALHESILTICQQFLLQDVKMITHHLNEHRKNSLNDAENMLKNHRRRLGEIEKQMKNITNAIAEGLSQPEMLEKLNELSGKRVALNSQMKEIEALTESRPVTEEAVKEVLGHFQELMITENSRELQLALGNMIDKIIVYDDHIEATFLVAS